MAANLKPLNEQVIVLTGATSGIGLATARLAASRGAKLVLAARDAGALNQLADELRRTGAEAEPVPTDVGVREQVECLSARAVARFGGFDTWVNNAGSSIFGHMIEVDPADHHKLFDVNFWGTVEGSLAAARHFAGRAGHAGAILNVGSVLGDRAIPTQGMYCASKFAVKGFTEAFRMELEESGVNAVVTLIKPSSIDTPFTHHAKNYLDEDPTLPPPVYHPELVAEAILAVAVSPQRDITVGSGGRSLALLGAHAPRLTDRLMRGTVTAMQKKPYPAQTPAGSLDRPRGPELRQQGAYTGPVFRRSLFTQASLHPVAASVLAAGAGLAVAAILGVSTTQGRK